MGVNVPVATEAPPVRLAEVAQLRGKVVPGAVEGSKDKAVAASAERAKQLREFDAKDKNPKTGIAEARNKRARPLSPTELTQLRRVNPALADEAAQFGTYTEVMAEAVKTGKEPAVVANEKGISGFDTARTAVVDRLSKLDVFQGMEEFKTMTPEQQHDFVESTVGTNDRVRAAYLQEMRKIGQEAIKLPEDQQNKVKGVEAQKQQTREAQRKVTIDRMRLKLGDKAKKLTNDEVEAMFAGGQTPQEARMAMTDKLLADNGVKPEAFHAQQEANAASARLAVLEGEFLGSHKGGPHAPKGFDLKGYLDGNGADPKVVEYRALQERKAIAEPLGNSLTPVDKAVIKEVTDKVYGVIDYIANGQPRVGGVEQDLQAVYESKRQDSTTPVEATLTDEQQQAERQAEAQKVALGEQMKNALAGAVEDTLDAQIDDARDIANRKMLAETADKDEAEKTMKDRALVRLSEQQDHNWIGMDQKSGHRTVNYDVIGHDVRYAGGAHGEEGVKRLQLRDLMMGTKDGPPIIQLKEGVTMTPDGKLINTQDGSPYTIAVPERQANGSYVDRQVQATYENIPLENLPAEGKSVLESIFAQTKDGYVTRMFMDLEQARHPHRIKEGLNILGNLKSINLTRDEIISAHNKLGNLVVDGIQKGKDGDQIMKKLEGMGLDITNEGKKGILPLLMMLMMLLGVGGIKKKEN